MADNTNALVKELRFHFQSLSRFIYVVTEEEDGVIKAIGNLLKKHEDQIKVYNPTTGWVPLPRYMEEWKTGQLSVSETMQIHNALIEALKENPQNQINFYLILDPERFFKDPHVVRRYLNQAHQLSNSDLVVKVFVFISSELFIPSKLSKYITVIRDKGLSDEDINNRLNLLSDRLDMKMPPGITRAFRGLTQFQIDAAVSQSLITTTKKGSRKSKQLDPKVIATYKRNQLNKSTLIEYHDPEEGFENIGGLDRFKAWAEETKACWTEEGLKFGLRPPKGVIAIGVYGCGKSISTKALARCWNIPLVRLDMGRLRSSGVGDTEANVYKMISLVESVAPVILWVDEAEKNLSGSESSAASDSGTTSRMLGIFSTWIQETSVPVCLAMTANRIKGLPSELLNRASERFFFDLPSEEERIDILKIHLRKIQRDPAKYPLQQLAEVASDLVGREIEQAIEAALRRSFHQDYEDLDAGVLEEELRTKPRILRTAVDDLEEIIQWVGYDPDVGDGVRARLASGSKSEAFGRIIDV